MYEEFGLPQKNFLRKCSHRVKSHDLLYPQTVIGGVALVLQGMNTKTIS